MSAIEIIRSTLQFTDYFAVKMIDDMRDSPLTQPTSRGGNHPLWIVGHLAASELGLRSMITGEAYTLEHWDSHFAPGTQPTGRAEDYPSYDEVVAAFRDQRKRTFELLDTLSDEDLSRAPMRTFPGAEAAFSTVGKVLNFIGLHQEFHMGQLADARRAAGREPLVAMDVLAEMNQG